MIETTAARDRELAALNPPEPLPSPAPTPQATRSHNLLLFKSLDIFRGLAVLAVLVCHIVGVASNYAPWLWDSSLARLLSGGYLGVEVFFVISGYCIVAACVGHLKRGSSLGRYAADRILRIYPSYWAALLLLLALVLLRSCGTAHLEFLDTYSAAHSEQRSLGNIVTNFLLIHCELGRPRYLDVSWTLCYEVAFYGIAGIGLFIGMRRGLNAMMNSLHALTICCLAAWVFRPHILPFPLDLWPQFGAGILLLDMRLRPRHRNVRVAVAGVVGMMICSLHSEYMIGYVARDNRKSTVVILLTLLVLALIQNRDEWFAAVKVFRPLLLLGKMSYSTYLIHYMVVGFAESVILSAAATKPRFFFAAGISFAFSIVLSYLFYLWIELPSTRLKQIIRFSARPAAGSMRP